MPPRRPARTRDRASCVDGVPIPTAGYTRYVGAAAVAAAVRETVAGGGANTTSGGGSAAEAHVAFSTTAAAGVHDADTGGSLADAAAAAAAVAFTEAVKTFPKGDLAPLWGHPSEGTWAREVDYAAISEGLWGAVLTVLEVLEGGGGKAVATTAAAFDMVNINDLRAAATYLSAASGPVCAVLRANVHAVALSRAPLLRCLDAVAAHGTLREYKQLFAHIRSVCLAVLTRAAPSAAAAAAAAAAAEAPDTATLATVKLTPAMQKLEVHAVLACLRHAFTATLGGGLATLREDTIRAVAGCVGGDPARASVVAELVAGMDATDAIDGEADANDTKAAATPATTTAKVHIGDTATTAGAAARHALVLIATSVPVLPVLVACAGAATLFPIVLAHLPMIYTTHAADARAAPASRRAVLDVLRRVVEAVHALGVGEGRGVHEGACARAAGAADEASADACGGGGAGGGEGAALAAQVDAFATEVFVEYTRDADSLTAAKALGGLRSLTLARVWGGIPGYARAVAAAADALTATSVRVRCAAAKTMAVLLDHCPLPVGEVWAGRGGRAPMLHVRESSDSNGHGPDAATMGGRARGSRRPVEGAPALCAALTAAAAAIHGLLDYHAAAAKLSDAEETSVRAALVATLTQTALLPVDVPRLLRAPFADVARGVLRRRVYERTMRVAGAAREGGPTGERLHHLADAVTADTSLLLAALDTACPAVGIVGRAAIAHAVGECLEHAVRAMLVDSEATSTAPTGTCATATATLLIHIYDARVLAFVAEALHGRGLVGGDRRCADRNTREVGRGDGAAAYDDALRLYLDHTPGLDPVVLDALYGWAARTSDPPGHRSPILGAPAEGADDVAALAQGDASPFVVHVARVGVKVVLGAVVAPAGGGGCVDSVAAAADDADADADIRATLALACAFHAPVVTAAARVASKVRVYGTPSAGDAGAELERVWRAMLVAAPFHTLCYAAAIEGRDPRCLLYPALLAAERAGRVRDILRLLAGGAPALRAVWAAGAGRLWDEAQREAEGDVVMVSAADVDNKANTRGDVDEDSDSDGEAGSTAAPDNYMKNDLVRRERAACVASYCALAFRNGLLPRYVAAVLAGIRARTSPDAHEAAAAIAGLSGSADVAAAIGAACSAELCTIYPAATPDPAVAQCTAGGGESADHIGSHGEVPGGGSSSSSSSTPDGGEGTADAPAPTVPATAGVVDVDVAVRLCRVVGVCIDAGWRDGVTALRRVLQSEGSSAGSSPARLVALHVLGRCLVRRRLHSSEEVLAAVARVAADGDAAVAARAQQYTRQHFMAEAAPGAAVVRLFHVLGGADEEEEEQREQQEEEGCKETAKNRSGDAPTRVPVLTAVLHGAAAAVRAHAAFAMASAVAAGVVAALTRAGRQPQAAPDGGQALPYDGTTAGDGAAVDVIIGPDARDAAALLTSLPTLTGHTLKKVATAFAAAGTGDGPGERTLSATGEDNTTGGGGLPGGHAHPAAGVCAAAAVRPYLFPKTFLKDLILVAERVAATNGSGGGAADPAPAAPAADTNGLGTAPPPAAAFVAQLRALLAVHSSVEGGGAAASSRRGGGGKRKAAQANAPLTAAVDYERALASMQDIMAAAAVPLPDL